MTYEDHIQAVAEAMRRRDAARAQETSARYAALHAEEEHAAAVKAFSDFNKQHINDVLGREATIDDWVA
jgi:hypothetical protein